MNKDDRKVGVWIKTEDGLPPEGEIVLLYLYDGIGNTYEIGAWDGEGWCVYCHSDPLSEYNVVAWYNFPGYKEI